MNRRRALSLAAALVLIAAGLAGCAPARADDTIVVLGTLPGPDLPAFRAAAAVYTERTGVPVTYQAAGNIKQALAERELRSERRPSPDIVLMENPGLFDGFAERGTLEPLEGVVDESAVMPALEGVGTLDGVRYGVPVQVGLSSLVWYPPEAFAAAGYEVPATYDQLIALTDRMRGDGRIPWCMGIESAQETGWVVTDWVEQLVLGGAGGEAYDRWVELDLPFTSPEVTTAAERFGRLLLEEGNTYGGRIGILSTPYRDAAAPMFEDPPGCWLHRQASWMSLVWPRELELGEDYDFFPFPVLDEEVGRALVGNVDLAGLVRPDAAAEEFLRFLATPEAAAAWAEVAAPGQFLSPYTTFDPAGYADDMSRRLHTLLAEADVFRPDGSLQMPDPVGSVAFHTQMIEWIFGRADLATALRAIEERAG